MEDTLKLINALQSRIEIMENQIKILLKDNVNLKNEINTLKQENNEYRKQNETFLKKDEFFSFKNELKNSLHQQNVKTSHSNKKEDMSELVPIKFNDIDDEEFESLTQNFDQEENILNEIEQKKKTKTKNGSEQSSDNIIFESGLMLLNSISGEILDLEDFDE